MCILKEKDLYNSTLQQPGFACLHFFLGTDCCGLWERSMQTLCTWPLWFFYGRASPKVHRRSVSMVQIRGRFPTGQPAEWANSSWWIHQNLQWGNIKKNFAIFYNFGSSIICHLFLHSLNRHSWSVYYVLHWGGKIMNKTKKIPAIMKFLSKHELDDLMFSN